MTDIAICVNNVSKVYPLYRSNRDRLLEAIHPLRKKYHTDFYALKDVSFEIKKGEAVGIIGQNGSGKSTLLKIITGVLTPTTGSVEVNGRISSLLELGTGFNPEMTGIENVFFYGTINGISREEMERRLDDILSFADIGDFVYQPVKTYSSGMFVRLAFACAINVEPDILIVDEALAVGDIRFQQKCFDKLRSLRDSGVTVLLVSHDRHAILATCFKAFLLHKSELLQESDAPTVLDYYNALLSATGEKTVEKKKLENGKWRIYSGTKDVYITSASLLDETEQPIEIVKVGQPLQIMVHTKVIQTVPRLVLGYGIKDRFGQIVFGTNTYHTSQVLYNLAIGAEPCFRIYFNANLGVGFYSVVLALTGTESHLEYNYDWQESLIQFQVINTNKPIFSGCLWLESKISVHNHVAR